MGGDSRLRRGGAFRDPDRRTALGANVVAVDISDDTLALARTAGAAHHDQRPHREPMSRGAVHELTGGGAQVSVDALGSKVTCRNSILSLRRRGRHVQVGLMLAEEADPPLPMARVIAWELELLGSHGMQAHAYGPMLAMIAAGKLGTGAVGHAADHVGRVGAGAGGDGDVLARRGDGDRPLPLTGRGHAKD